MKALTIVLVFGALASLAGCNKSTPDTKTETDKSASVKALETGIPKCRMNVLDTKTNDCEKK